MRFAYRRPTPRWLVAHNRRRDHPGPPAELDRALDAPILAELSDTYCGEAHLGGGFSYGEHWNLVMAINGAAYQGCVFRYCWIFNQSYPTSCFSL